MLIMGTVGMGLYMTADAGQTVTGCEHLGTQKAIRCSNVREYQIGSHPVGSDNSPCKTSRVGGVHDEICLTCLTVVRTFNTDCYELHSHPDCPYKKDGKLCGGTER